MKSLKTTISITELQKTIKIWRSRKITDSTIPKLLDLYLGLTAYMNDKHIYPVENFYDIKMSLRFSTTQSLIEAVKGNVEEGLFFCGANVGRLDRMRTVRELMDELVTEWRQNQ